MSNGVSTKIQKIKEERIGATSKVALIFEGLDDVIFYSEMLTKWHTDWESKFCIAEAGGKKNVVDILTREPGWFGIVDRDEWNDAAVEEQQATHSKLWISPRFCVENYLIVPQELWAAFPQLQRDKIPAGEQHLRNTLLTDIDRWIAHGVLWSVINPLWEGLRSRGFKEDLLVPDVALDNNQIRQKLNEWHQFLDPEQIIARYNSTLKRVRTLSQDEQLMRWVHGKSFYETVVNPALNTLLGKNPQRTGDQVLSAPCRFLMT